MSRRIPGFREAEELLRQVAARASNVTPAWPAVGDYVAEQVGRQFDTQGSHFGTTWDPRKPVYGSPMDTGGWDPNNPPGAPLLVELGDLRDSFTSRPMSVERYGRQEAAFGSDDYRAKFHHRGTRHIPARPILVATNRMAEDVADILARYITEGRTT